MGVALLWPNVRGSVGFGRKFTQMDDGKGREGAIKDIGALLDWIANRPDLDRDRVVLAGPATAVGWRSRRGSFTTIGSAASSRAPG